MRQQIVSHHGARDLWPENSRLGFRNALALGVDAIEFDVHPTRDGQLAVIHDATLDRTTDAVGPVSVRSLVELREVRLNGADAGVPSLGEVLEILLPSRRALPVELKADAGGVPYDGLPHLVLAEIDRCGIADHVVLTSFDPVELSRPRELRPAIALLASVNAAAAKLHGVEALLAVLAEQQVDYIAVEKGLLDTRFANFTRRLPGARLGVWVVNSPVDIARWTAASVGLITTDTPDLLLEARSR